MPKYRVTINFETDRVLHADEQEQILWACHAQIEEPVDYDQNDIDVRVERVTESIRSVPESRVSASDLAEHMKADILADDELSEEFRACDSWEDLHEVCDANVYVLNACESYGVNPHTDFDKTCDAQRIVAEWLPTRRESVSRWGQGHDDLIAKLKSRDIKLEIVPTGGGCWNFYVDSTKHEDWSVMLGNAHTEFSKSDFGVCVEFECGWTDLTRDMSVLLSNTKPIPAIGSSVGDVADWMTEMVGSMDILIGLNNA